MANVKISELDELVNVANDDYLPIVDTSAGETKKVKVLRIGTGGKSGDTLPIGSMIPYGDSTAPANWLICDGSEVSRTTYADLFAVIGTSYGAGDGSTTFNLPNKKGKISVGLDAEDTDFNTIGKTGGSKLLQSHKHSVYQFTNNGKFAVMTEYNTTAGSVISKIANASTATSVAYTDEKQQGMVSADYAGEGDSQNLQPFEVDCWIIKAFQSAGVVANVAEVQTDSDVDVYSCNYVNVKGKFIKVSVSSQKNFGQDTKTKIGFERVIRNNFNDDYDNYFKLNSDGTVQVMSDKIKTVMIILSYQKLSTTTMNSYIDVTNKGTIAVGMTDTNTALSSVSVCTDVSKDDLITGSLYSGGGSGILSAWASASWMQVIAI